MDTWDTWDRCYEMRRDMEGMLADSLACLNNACNGKRMNLPNNVAHHKANALKKLADAERIMARIRKEMEAL